MNPTAREKALNAALEFLRGTGHSEPEVLIDAARKIEAYLEGYDTDPNVKQIATGTGGTGPAPAPQPIPVKKADW